MSWTWWDRGGNWEKGVVHTESHRHYLNVEGWPELSKACIYSVRFKI